MPRMTRARKLLRQVATPGLADRGGVAVIVSVLLAGGVLLGMAALSVDVGQLTAEREELMSAADGSAQSIAIDCAKTPANCQTSTALAHVTDRAATIADANGKDGLNDITLICGRGGALAPCDPNQEPTNLTACLNTPPASAKYVEVHTATRTSATSTVLPTAFAGTFVSGYKGGAVGACSRVAWGPPGGGLSLTFAGCEWNSFTNGGADYVNYQPGGPNPPASVERIIDIHGAGASTCTGGNSSGQDGPGGFGWLDPDNPSSCSTSIPSSGWYPGSTGSNFTDACIQAVYDAQRSRKPVLIPVYDNTQGPAGKGANLTYPVLGIAAFVVTGYYLGNGVHQGTTDAQVPEDVPSWLTGLHLCSQNDRCLYGFFVSPLLDASTPIGSTDSDFGPMVIKTVG